LQGTSRGGANIKEIVRRIDLWGLDMVFVIGGNGGNAAANAIQQEVERQGVRCVVAGVPKSIDNDILLVSGDAAEQCLGVQNNASESAAMLHNCASVPQSLFYFSSICNQEVN
jgi:6-phosphofructokinase 1